MINSQPMIHLENITLEYPNSYTALKNINLEIHNGEFLCIVGPTGCGKSTLLKILMGLTTHTSGKISINRESFANKIAYISQASSMLPWRNLWQNVTLGIEISESVDDYHIQLVKQLLREYGLTGFEKLYPKQLSGGMQRRADIIRALGTEPKLLICDEIFSAIDFVQRLQFNSLLRSFCKRGNTTTILVTHNIEEAIFLGDRVCVMSRRPGTIINTYNTQLSLHAEDAVKARQSGEFITLFNQIWQDLQEDYEKTI